MSIHTIGLDPTLEIISYLNRSEIDQLAATSKALYQAVRSSELGRFTLVVTQVFPSLATTIQDIFCRYIERPTPLLITNFLKSFKPDQFQLVANEDFSIRIKLRMIPEWIEQSKAIGDLSVRDQTIKHIFHFLIRLSEKQIYETTWSKAVNNAMNLMLHIENKTTYEDAVSSICLTFLKRSLIERNDEASTSIVRRAMEMTKIISDEAVRNHTLFEMLGLLSSENKSKSAEKILISHGIELINLISKPFLRDIAHEQCARTLARKSYFESNPIELRKATLLFASRIEKHILKQQFYNYFFNYLVQEFGFDDAITTATWISDQNLRITIQTEIERSRVKFLY